MTDRSHFFAYMARMKFIRRWSIMRNSLPENIQEHSLQVALIAHVLAVIRRKIFHKDDVSPERAATLAAFHDATEVITGDMVTPIKYFNPEIKAAYDKIEHVASERLLNMLPEELQAEYRPLLFQQEADQQHKRLVKAADKLTAYLKCVEELRTGNNEFAEAHRTIKADLKAMELQEVEYFLEIFAPSFELCMDKLN